MVEDVYYALQDRMDQLEEKVKNKYSEGSKESFAMSMGIGAARMCIEGIYMYMKTSLVLDGLNYPNGVNLSDVLGVMNMNLSVKGLKSDMDESVRRINEYSLQMQNEMDIFCNW